MTAPVIAAPPRPASPFKGLTPYTEEDAAFFFGRDEEIEVAIANLEARRLTLLYGESGVGKSSLLRAGVVHRLRESARRNLEEIGTPEFIPVYFATWRDDPLAALLEEIRRSVSAVLGEPAHEAPPSGRLDEALELWSTQAGADILVVLDQFEESFLYHERDQGMGTFAGELPRVVNSAGLRARFLLAIREDALAKLDRFKREIPTLFGTYLRLRHLDRNSARDAITRPIEEYNRLATASDEGVEIEPALVEAVLDQVTAGRVVLEQAAQGLAGGDGVAAGEERIETPYLQLVMTRLWKEEMRRSSRLLRLSTLHELGDAQTIVRTHLDDALGALTVDQQDLVADLFNHLVTPSGTKIAHTPSDLAAYTGRPLETIVPVLETLSSGQTRILRPVSSGEGPARYEIFHDVLAAAVLDWRARRIHGRLEREREAAEAEARHERRRARAFRALAGLATLLMVFSGALAVVVWQRSEHQARIDESREIAASARDLLDTRLDLAIPLALEAYDRAGTLEAQSTLLAATHRAARLVRLMRPDGTQPIWAAAFDPAGVHLATAGGGGLAIWDRAGRSIKRLQGKVTSFAFSPRGDLIVASSDDGLTLWETKTWASKRPFRAALNSTSVEFSSNGALVAALNANGLETWRVNGRRPKPVKWHAPVDVSNVAFSPTDPTLLAVVAGRERRLRLWEVGAPLPLASGPANIDALAFSRDGRLLALANGDQRIQLWSVVTHKAIGEARGGHTGPVVSLAFSADGKTLASGARDRSVILWDVARPEAPQRIGDPLRARSEVISKLTFTGDLLVVTSSGGTVTLWDARRHRGPFATIYIRELPSQSVLSPDGRLLASFDTATRTSIWDVGTARKYTIAEDVSVPVKFTLDNTKLLTLDSTGSAVRYRFWDVRTRRAIDLPPGVPGDANLALAGNGSFATEKNSTITLWDDAGNRLASTNAGGTVSSLAVSSDAKDLAWGYQDGRVGIWRPLEDRPPTIFPAHKSPVTKLAFRPDARLLAVASEDTTISLWDVESAQPTGTLVGHSEIVKAVAFSADGKTLASGAEDSTIRLWDVKSHRPLGEALLTPAPVSDVAFGPRGLVALTSDGTVVVWGTSLWSIERKTRNTLRTRLCGLIGEVDSTEWKNVLGEKSPHEPCAAGTPRRTG